MGIKDGWLELPLTARPVDSAGTRLSGGPAHAGAFCHQSRFYLLIANTSQLHFFNVLLFFMTFSHLHARGQQPGGKSLLSLDALCCGCGSPLGPPAVRPWLLSAAPLQETRYNRLEKHFSLMLSVPAIVPVQHQSQRLRQGVKIRNVAERRSRQLPATRLLVQTRAPLFPVLLTSGQEICEF